jgi:hypothetical protein
MVININEELGTEAINNLIELTKEGKREGKK